MGIPKGKRVGNIENIFFVGIFETWPTPTLLYKYRNIYHLFFKHLIPNEIERW